MRWYNVMSDGTLANHWPATDVDERSGGSIRLVSASDLAAMVRRLAGGQGTLDDRLALIDLACEIEADAPATELAALAQQLRRVAGAV